MASRSRRQYAKERRDCRMGLTFTRDEVERVRAAAKRNGMAPAAWAAKAALDRADGRDAALADGHVSPEVLAALIALVVEMQGAGSNFNQSVKKLIATGQRPGRLAVQADRLMDVIDRAGDAIEELRPPRHW